MIFFDLFDISKLFLNCFACLIIRRYFWIVLFTLFIQMFNYRAYVFGIICLLLNFGIFTINNWISNLCLINIFIIRKYNFCCKKFYKPYVVAKDHLWTTHNEFEKINFSTTLTFAARSVTTLCRVCHWFSLMIRDDYFQVNFDQF